MHRHENNQGNSSLQITPESAARALSVQAEQLPTEGEFLEHEILAGAEDADDPAKQVSEPHDHGSSLIALRSVEPGAKSLELRMYGVLRTHSGEDRCVLDGGHLPLKCAKFGEPTVVALIGGENSYA